LKMKKRTSHAMDNIVFRKIEKENYPEIAGIYNHYVLNSTATYHVGELPVEGVVSYFEIEGAETFPFCIFLDGKMCGFCLIRPYSKKQAYQYTYEITIYLSISHTKRGIGSLAIKYLEDVARQNKIKTLVGGVCIENEGSIRLFQKNMYKKCGHFRNMGFKFGRMLDNVYFQKFL
jgi:L-amino acid N-acyltransferase YncA